MTTNKAFEFLPWLEVLVRNFYWRISVLQKFIASRKKKKKTLPNPDRGFSIDELVFALRESGIKKDDVVIVHSSMKKLSESRLNSKKIIDIFLKNLLPRGILVCPTFPLYIKEPKGIERLKKDISNIEFVYNIQTTRPWTGELGRTLMQTSGARRSIHPLNTVTACGKDVDRIFSNESVDTLDLPCGTASTWAELVSLNAKIVMLGVDLAHSLTMIHVAEDCYESEWPIKKWYRKRKFCIIDKGKKHHVTIRERHPRWALSYAEKKLSHDLYTKKIAQKFQVGSIEVTILESQALIAFLNSKKKKGYPYYMAWLSRL